MKLEVLTLQLMTEVELVPNLKSLDLDGLVAYIKEGHAKNVVFLTGAGTSVAAGIPDFRTPKIGLYSKLDDYNLPFPEAVFTLDFFDENPVPFFQISKDLLPGNLKPVTAHYFTYLFQKNKILKRLYTQNIDGLDLAAGVEPEFVIEAHGGYNTLTCRKCQKKYLYTDYKDILLRGEVPYCKCEGVLKPDVVFFGEGLPKRFFANINEDFKDCDLFIVMGTSLAVYPCAGLVEHVPSTTPRVLINLNPVKGPKEDGTFKFDLPENTRDIFIGGDLQDSCKKIAEALGWGEDLNNLLNK